VPLTGDFLPCCLMERLHGNGTATADQEDREAAMMQRSRPNRRVA
jgi:hypothetical protein